MAREELALVDAPPYEVPNTYHECWDPRLDPEVEVLTSIEDLKEVHIGPHAHQVTKIGTSLFEEEERELVDRLIKNVEEAVSRQGELVNQLIKNI